MGSKPNDFCPYKRREAQIHREEGHVEAGRGGGGRGEAAPDPETQGAPEAGRHRKDSPLHIWEEVWPVKPWILDLQPPQL